jgi:hypothetical protein
MTKDQVKAAIRDGRPTPGVDATLFESAYHEVLQEDHPGWRVTTLLESKGSGDPLPTSVHDRVVAMLNGSTTRRAELRQMDEAKRHGPPPTTADTRLLLEAAERFRHRTDPAAITARALDRDRNTPKPRRHIPTLQEAMADADRLPRHIHAVVARQCGGIIWPS